MLWTLANIIGPSIAVIPNECQVFIARILLMVACEIGKSATLSFKIRLILCIIYAMY